MYIIGIGTIIKIIIHILYHAFISKYIYWQLYIKFKQDSMQTINTSKKQQINYLSKC